MGELLQKTELKIEIRREEIPSWRAALGTIREKKGLENVTISLSRALRASLESLGLYGEVVNLDWEEFLSGQHIVMNELANPKEVRDVEVMKKALGIMEESANRAHAYIISREDLGEQEKRSYRFLGRLADYKGDYPNAIENYKKSISMFESEEDPMIQVNGLEVSGFLAYSLIMDGQTEEGLDLANRTYKDFFESEDGKQLRGSDYYTWAVWASGVSIRSVGALIDKGFLTDKKWAEDWINKADSLLVIPENDDSWGDKNFAYRKDEIASVREKLARL